jgi:hypothetical protein
MSARPLTADQSSSGGGILVSSKSRNAAISLPGKEPKDDVLMGAALG